MDKENAICSKDTLSRNLLELIAISGEFPQKDLHRIAGGKSYKESVVSFPTAVQRYNKKRQFVPIVQRFGVDCSIVYHKLLIFSIDFGISQMTKKSSFSSDESSWMPYPFSGLNFSTWRGKYFFYATQIEKRREGAYIIT